MRISRRHLWVACLAAGIVIPTAVVTGAFAATTDSGPSLTTVIQIDPATGGVPTVRFAARNVSPAAVDVLARDLPQARQSAAVMTVTRDGEPVPYRGRLVKYAAPTATDYVHIPAGGEYTTTVNLADDYDLSQPGTYTVTLASEQVRVRKGAPAATPGTARVKPGRATVRTNTGVRGSAKAPEAGNAPTTTETVTTTAAAAVSVVYRGCSSSQQSQLRQAVSDAAQYSANAGSWLAAHPSGGGLYGTWFGAYDSSRFSR